MTIALAFLINRLRHQVIAIRTERSFQRLVRYVKFDPDQPRDELGRWQETGEQEDSHQSDEGGDISSMLAAARGQSARETVCAAQYDRDIFQCSLVGISACYQQAMIRFVACMKGQQIPPLNY